MAEIKSSFRVANKADSGQWTPATATTSTEEDDGLFEQYIDSDPLDLSSSDNTADHSDFSLFFDVPGSPCGVSDPSKPLSGVEAAPKLQAPSGPHPDHDHYQQVSDDSPLLPSSSPPTSSPNEQDFSVVDAFALSLLSPRRAFAPSPSQHKIHVEDELEGEVQDQHRHCRTSSDCSGNSTANLQPGGNVDSASLAPRDRNQRVVSIPPTMAQPAISRQTTQDAWAQRLEQRVENYSFSSSHGTPLTPISAHSRQSPVAKQSGGHGGNPYQTYNFNGASAASNGQITPYQRGSQTPVTPNFNDFSMDSVITSPQVDRPQNWDDHPISPFDFQYDPNSSPQHPPQHHQPSHQHQMQPFDEGRVQPWWSPTTSGAQGQRYNRQTSAPAMAQSQSSSQPQYGSFYPTTTQQMAGSGLMINCQPGANEMSISPSLPPGSSMYASSAPAAHSSIPPYQRNQSMPHAQPVRRTGSHPTSQGHQSSVSSSATSRRTSKSSSNPHRRSKSSASPPRQGAKDNAQGGTVGFVNFTPNDSKRILTGVAPSGSSKTKARREKEAAERRRRLNEAAQRAVMEAGGDVSALERSGLFAS